MKGDKITGIIRAVLLIVAPALCILLFMRFLYPSGSKVSEPGEKAAANTVAADQKSNSDEEETDNNELGLAPVYTDGKHISVAAVSYEIEHPVRTYVIAGTDGSGNTDGIGDEYSGDFSDSIMVLAIDDTKKQFGIIQLDRNTMVNVPVLDNQGVEVYSFYMQICTASVYGGSMDRGEKNLCDCVSALFGGVPIDGYYAIPIGAIAKVNDAVGGVDVTIEDDFSKFDKSLEMGKTVTLHGDQAETYLRTRKDISDGLNRTRMRRQRQYIRAFYEKFLAKISGDKSFAAEFFKTLRHETYTNIAMEELVDGMADLKDYKNLGVLEPLGVAEIGDTYGSGEEFEENYMNFNSLREILEEVYPVKQMGV